MNAITPRDTNCCSGITVCVHDISTFPEDIILEDGTAKNPWKQLAAGQIVFIALQALDFISLDPVPKIFAPAALAIDIGLNIKLWNGPRGPHLRSGVDLSFCKDLVGGMMLAFIYLAENPPQGEIFVHLVRGGFVGLLLLMSVGVVAMANIDRLSRERF